MPFPESLETPTRVFLSPDSGIPGVPGGTGERSPSASEAEGGTEKVPEQGGKCWALCCVSSRMERKRGHAGASAHQQQGN